ncbi:MAG: hypothetical protein ABIL58_17595 [Pseudomonadota bacterium]
MNAFWAHFQSFPSSAKNGIILLIAAWSWLFFSINRFFLPGELPERVLAAGIMACIIIFKVRSWARVLCILGNALAILAHIQFAYHFFMVGDSVKAFAAVITIVLFSASTIYLGVPQTAGFYKKHTPDPAAALEGKNDPQEGGPSVDAK